MFSCYGGGVTEWKARIWANKATVYSGRMRCRIAVFVDSFHVLLCPSKRSEKSVQHTPCLIRPTTAAVSSVHGAWKFEVRTDPAFRLSQNSIVFLGFSRFDEECVMHTSLPSQNQKQSPQQIITINTLLCLLHVPCTRTKQTTICQSAFCDPSRNKNP